MDFRESLPEFYLVATSLEIMKTYHVADWESTGREAGLSSACENREGLWSESTEDVKDVSSPLVP